MPPRPLSVTWPCTADGTNVSIDGPPAGQSGQGYPLVPNGNPFQSGSDQPDFNDRFDGVIDEVQIFNRALSASEIQAIYNAGKVGVR
jgi:hypothetical protein